MKKESRGKKINEIEDEHQCIYIYFLLRIGNSLYCACVCWVSNYTKRKKNNILISLTCYCLYIVTFSSHLNIFCLFHSSRFSVILFVNRCCLPFHYVYYSNISKKKCNGKNILVLYTNTSHRTWTSGLLCKLIKYILYLVYSFNEDWWRAYFAWSGSFKRLKK